MIIVTVLQTLLVPVTDCPGGILLSDISGGGGRGREAGGGRSVGRGGEDVCCVAGA